MQATPSGFAPQLQSLGSEASAAGFSGVVQRDCACGAKPGVSGDCAECAGEEDGPIQPKLTLNTPGDSYEREADRVADAVTSGGFAPGSRPAITPLTRSAPAAANGSVQTKAAPGETGAGPTATQSAASALDSGGRPLSRADRAYFEPRFGRDLSSIRIHTGSRAGQAARGIGASAYTLRGNIAFAPGQYAPETPQGRRLLAHELTHTMQQGGDSVIRRTCPMDPAEIPAGSDEDFERMAGEIRATSGYRGLSASDRRIANHIIDGARGSACPMYYITMLELVFATTESPDVEQEARGRAEIVEAATEEQERLAAPEAAANTGLEEGISGDPSRDYTTPRAGEGGTLFDVDARDANDIVVRMRVSLSPAGTGKTEDVENTKSLEDGIEKAGSTRGYTLDIEFVDRCGPDVFEVGVDPSQWTTSGNWVGDPATMAHEAHHLLGLADRYNYIESHAGNEDMDIPDRLYWFREQMVRAADPLSSTSMMANEESGPLDDMDVCAVAGGDFEGCLTNRMYGLSMAELEARGRALNAPYYPQYAAILLLMQNAWVSQCFTEFPSPLDYERIFSPLFDYFDIGMSDDAAMPADCFNPPPAAFGDPMTVNIDAGSYPLANPHDQPEGISLARTAATP